MSVADICRRIVRQITPAQSQPCTQHLGPWCGNKTRKTRSGVQDGLEVEKVVVVVYLVFLMDLTIRQ